MASQRDTNLAFKEDIESYKFSIEEDAMFDAMSTLTFMRAQGFLTQQDIEWWAGAAQLKKYEFLRKRIDANDELLYY